MDFRQGSFYLGRSGPAEAPDSGPASGARPSESTPAPTLERYDARDLVTHAVIVGMTGSG